MLAGPGFRPGAGRLAIAAGLTTLLFSAPPSHQPPFAAGGRRDITAAPARAPQPFEENRGQAGEGGGFLTRGAGFAARLDADGIDLVLPDGESAGSSPRLRIGFLAGQATEPPAGIERLQGVVNYLAGGDRTRWITGIPTHAAVSYSALYDGIDLTVRGDHRRLALDFALAPRADAGRIALALDAGEASPAARVEAGALLLDLGRVRLKFAEPAGTTLEYDGHRLSLRGTGGDPETERALHLTLERTDAPAIASEARVAVDRAGNLHLAGRTTAPAFEPAGGTNASPAAIAGMFVSRLDRDAVTPRFTTYLAGDAGDRPHGLVADEAGGVTLSGSTRSADFPGAPAETAVDAPRSRRPDEAPLEFAVRLDEVGVAPAGATRLDPESAATQPGHAADVRAAAARATRPEISTEVTDAAVDPDGRTIVAGFDRAGGWRPGRLVQPAPAGGLLYAGPVADGSPSPEAAGCPGTIQFDNSAGTGAWATTTNWDLNRLPTSTDDVCIPAGFTVTMAAGALPINTLFVTAGSSLALNANGTLSLATASQVNGTLTLSGGSITGAGTLDIATTFNWSAGTMTGAGTVNANAGASISGATVKDLSASRLFVTSGTVTWTGTGSMRVGTGGTIQNNGTWDAQSNATISQLGALPSLFQNLSGATFRKTGSGGGTTTIDIPFDNAGTLDIQHGIVNLSAGGAGTSVFQGASGTTLRFGGGTHTLGALSSVNVANLSVTVGTVDISGALTSGATTTAGTVTIQPAATVGALGGTLTVTGGILTLGSQETINLASLTLSGGTLQGGDTVNVAGDFNWTGGILSGSGTLNSNGPLIVSGAQVKDLTQSRVLNVNAATTWTGTGSIRMGTGAVIHNAATWSAGSDASLLHNLGGTALFDNKSTATFRKTAGTGTTTIDAPFDNLGTLDIQTGTVSLTGGGTGSGPVTGASGTTLRFGGGTHTLGASASVSVPNLLITIGTLDVSCPVNVSTGTTVDNGTVTFNPAATLTSLGTGLTMGGGTLTLSSGEAIGLTTLGLNGGTLQGSDTITVSGTTSWVSGIMTGSGITNADGGVTFSTVFVKDLTGSRLLNTSGTTHWAGPVRLGGSATIRNQGVWQSENDGSMQAVGSLTGSFENLSGSVLRKTAGAGTTSISVPFNNAGDLDVQIGTVALGDGGTSTGNFGGSPGTSMVFSFGAYTLGAASSLSVPSVSVTSGSLAVNGVYGATASTGISAGTLTFNPAATVTGLGSAVTVTGGTLTLNSGEAIDVDTLTISGGSLAGTDTVTVDGSLAWSGGDMSGAGVTIVTNGGTISGIGVKDLVLGREMATMGGTVTWTGTGAIRLGGSALIHNDGATWDAQSDAAISPLAGGGLFINHETSTFRKTVGAGATSFTLPLDNDGAVEIQSGIIELGGSGTGAGSFTGSAGTTLRVSAGTYTLAAPSSVSVPTLSVTGGTLEAHGALAATTATSVSNGTLRLYPDATVTALGGAVSVTNGTIDLSSDEAISVASLSLSTGTLLGTDTLSVTGVTTWSQGTVGGLGILNANGGIAISGVGVKDITGSRRLNTAGSSTWTGTGPIRLTDLAVIHNDGAWDVQNDAQVLKLGGTNGGLFENASGALFRKTAGALTTTVDIPFTNAGSVQGFTGTISYTDGFTQSAGAITAQGGTITSTAPLAIQGGIIGGTSTFNVGVVNGGNLVPGLSPGSVAITGALTQGAGSSFDVEIGGLTPGTQHDRAVVGGAVALAGTLNVTLANGFAPADHDLFTVMTFPSSSGEFSTFNFPPLAGGMAWKYIHNPTSIVLEALADLDGDGTSNAIDCLPNDPTVWSVPAEVGGVALTLNGQTLSWSSLAVQAGPATVYDVMRGLISQLPTGGGAAETCLVSDTASTQIVDATAPAVGTGLYYLVRGANVCGIGTWGNRSNGTPRATPVCP